MTAFLTRLRKDFHHQLGTSGVLSINEAGSPSNADKSQKSSRLLAQEMLTRMGIEAPNRTPLQGQTVGKEFERLITEYLSKALSGFEMLRPGVWRVENVGTLRGTYHLSNYVPYTHLDLLAQATKEDPSLAAILGNSYEISPDVLVLREPFTDAFINATELLVDQSSGRRSPLRSSNGSNEVVHAVVSCKWTLRSDRAQNARSEALGLIRNRKGRSPHIVVVTAEPSPSRLASLALGTGDIDTVYHVALPELIESAVAMDKHENLQMLTTLTDGDRLRDISDLPLDLLL